MRIRYVAVNKKDFDDGRPKFLKNVSANDSINRQMSEYTNQVFNSWNENFGPKGVEEIVIPVHLHTPMGNKNPSQAALKQRWIQEHVKKYQGFMKSRYGSEQEKQQDLAKWQASFNDHMTRILSDKRYNPQTAALINNPQLPPGVAQGQPVRQTRSSTRPLAQGQPVSQGTSSSVPHTNENRTTAFRNRLNNIRQNQDHIPFEQYKNERAKGSEFFWLNFGPFKQADYKSKAVKTAAADCMISKIQGEDFTPPDGVDMDNIKEALKDGSLGRLVSNYVKNNPDYNTVDDFLNSLDHHVSNKP
jgi:hypothetical protein